MAQKVATARKMKSRQETTSLGQIATVTAKPSISDKRLWTLTLDVLKFRRATWDTPPPLPFVKWAVFLRMKIECSPKTWFIPQTVKFDPSELLPLPSTWPEICVFSWPCWLNCAHFGMVWKISFSCKPEAMTSHVVRELGSSPGVYRPIRCECCNNSANKRG